MRHALTASLLLAAGLIGAPATALAQLKWDMPTGYAVGSFQTVNVQQFADEVDKATAGRLKITLHPNGALYKANEIKRAVQSGQVQIGEFILSGAANENALFGVDSVPFLADSYAQARKLSTLSRPAIDRLLASQGMKLLFVSPWPGQNLYSVKPVASAADLKATKMRAYNPATSRIAQLLGAQATTIQLAELGQALATGTVENFLTSSASGVEMKLHESVKHFYTVNAWLPRNAIVVNTKAFATLDAATQKTVLDAAAAAEARGWASSEQKDAEYLKELAARGMKIAAPSPALAAELKKVGVTMTAEWLEKAGPEGRAIVDAFLK
ncbi:MAG TPA: TRAP transporter substrate-binding protein [Rubrivivax sp.]|jgi:TRAP-type C4-dicarboxylate transport system substrate-binding protein|nr:TRAP transporter substrate-binding protein [Rubrivivax sp.]